MHQSPYHFKKKIQMLIHDALIKMFPVMYKYMQSVTLSKHPHYMHIKSCSVSHLADGVQSLLKFAWGSNSKVQRKKNQLFPSQNFIAIPATYFVMVNLKIQLFFMNNHPFVSILNRLILQRTCYFTFGECIFFSPVIVLYSAGENIVAFLWIWH